MHQFKPLAFAFAFAFAFLALPPSAHAQQKCGEVPTVLLIQDRSGSMLEKVGTQTKWDMARGALSVLSNQYGDKLNLGLMLYPQWPDTTICANGAVNVAPALKNQTTIITTLNKVVPKGNTPLTSSLDKAGDFIAKAKTKVNHVIVVTDGKETCLTPSAPLNAGGSCSWNNGTNFRKCGDCGWQFCLSSGKWSSACSPKKDVYPCLLGQTCGTNALCTGASTGSTSAKKAMANLASKGITGHVIGFGANVDKQVLQDLATAGGTTNFQYAANTAALQTALNGVVAGINCCGNGALDPGEKCDPKIAPGVTGSCPTKCDDGKACTADTVTGTACSVECKYTPITTPKDGDGCCPPGATSATDRDCKPTCGNGVLDAGEKCDPGIAQGQPGACITACDDKDPCTTDILGGAKCNPVCTTSPVAADATKKDSCCPKTPANLTVTDDPDCPPPCGPGVPDGGPCVDLCKGKNCPAGHYCVAGKCIPYPKDSGPAQQDMTGAKLDGVGGGNFTGVANETGCDCNTGSGGSGVPVMLLLLGLLLVARRRG